MKIKKVKKSKFRKKLSLLLLISILGLSNSGCNSNLEKYEGVNYTDNEELLEIDLLENTDVSLLFDEFSKIETTDIDVKVNALFSDKLDELLEQINGKGLSARTVEITVYGYDQTLLNSLASINAQSIIINCCIDHNIDDLKIEANLNGNTKRLKIVFSSLVDVNSVDISDIIVNSQSDIINVSIHGSNDAKVTVSEEAISSSPKNIIYIIENPIVKSLK